MIGGAPKIVSAENDSNTVYVFEINDEIAEPVWHNMQKAFSQAITLNASAIVINMNTYGGGVVMADSIRTTILRSEVPVYMLINNNAASAGALISIACTKIYMTPGSTIGAATVVTQDGAPAIDKYQSYFRSKMRATAEVTGRDPDIAEAMVDQDIEIKGITEKGKLLTFTVTEALAHNYCDKEVNSLQELLKDNNLESSQIVHYTPSSIDILISLLINPAVSGVLIMVMMGGIYFELQSPGIGFPIAAAALSAVLFFAPLYLEGMAENWEIVVFAIGILAIAAEVFVVPGTGITGILGITLVIGGLTLSMVKNVQLDFTMVRLDGLLMSFSIVLMSLLVMAVLTIVMLPKMLLSGRLQALVLNKSQEVSDGYVGIDQTIQTQIGQKGFVVTDLRPSGKIIIDGNHYDATSFGSYITKGTEIEVIETEGPQLIVRTI
jgi:membrane-bound serine protease (ClpP class)